MNADDDGARQYVNTVIRASRDREQTINYFHIEHFNSGKTIPTETQVRRIHNE